MRISAPLWTLVKILFIYLKGHGDEEGAPPWRSLLRSPPPLPPVVGSESATAVGSEQKQCRSHSQVTAAQLLKPSLLPRHGVCSEPWPESRPRSCDVGVRASYSLAGHLLLGKPCSGAPLLATWTLSYLGMAVCVLLGVKGCCEAGLKRNQF